MRTCSAVLFLAATLAGQVRAGILGQYTLSHSFDASVAVPTIAIGGVYFDEPNHRLYLAGSTDFSQQPSIRVFTEAGSFVNQINVLSSSRGGLSGLAAVPGSSDFYTIDYLNRIYRINSAGTPIASRDLNGSFISGGVQGAGDVAVDRISGNIWIAESSSPFRLIEVDPNFNLLQSINMSPLLGNLGIPGYAGVIGMDIDPLTGNFLVSGIFGKTPTNDLIYKILEINSGFTTILSEFTAFPANQLWESITGVSIGSQSRKIFATSGDNDHVFELSLVPEPSGFAMAAFAIVGLRAWRSRRRC